LNNKQVKPQQLNNNPNPLSQIQIEPEPTFILNNSDSQDSSLNTTLTINEEEDISHEGLTNVLDKMINLDSDDIDNMSDESDNDENEESKEKELGRNDDDRNIDKN